MLIHGLSFWMQIFKAVFSLNGEEVVVIATSEGSLRPLILYFFYTSATHSWEVSLN